jgi:hypothetical protein
VGGLGWGLLRRRRSPVVWLFVLHVLAGWVAWFYTYQSVRFLLPQLGLGAVAGIAAIAFVARRRRAFRVAAAPIVFLLAVAGIAWHLSYSLAMNYKRPLAGALGIVPGEIYLSNNLNFYDAVEWLNLEVEEGESVFYIGEHRGLYAKYPAVYSDWFDVPRVLVDIRATDTNDELLRYWRELGVRYVLWNYDELGRYEWNAFEPRFTRKEWQRFLDLRQRLLARRALVISPRKDVFVIDLELVP